MGSGKTGSFVTASKKEVLKEVQVKGRDFLIFRTIYNIQIYPPTVNGYKEGNLVGDSNREDTCKIVGVFSFS
jgi:hypothetical protein